MGFPILQGPGPSPIPHHTLEREEWKSQGRLLLLDKEHAIEKLPQFHSWSKRDRGQRRGGGCVVKNLASRLCLPLCDLEPITFPFWAWVASSVNGGWEIGLHFSNHNQWSGRIWRDKLGPPTHLRLGNPRVPVLPHLRPGGP